jgi:hypothetical protein
MSCRRVVILAGGHESPVHEPERCCVLIVFGGPLPFFNRVSDFGLFARCDVAFRQVDPYVCVFGDVESAGSTAIFLVFANEF